MDGLTFLSELIWPVFLIGILLAFKKPIKEFLETLKEWTEIKYKDILVKRENRSDKIEAPEPTGTELPGPVALSDEANKVLSTLWKHQRDYYDDHTRGRWSFAVGIASPLYADYLIGVGEAIKAGLVITSPKNGQTLLTDAGVRYCGEHQDQLLPDWNFQRWKTV
jgi:hypothetical protein